jgi:hypothetical protein
MAKRVVLSGNTPGLAAVDATLADLATDASGDSTKALFGDGTFKVPAGGGGGVTVNSATVSLTSAQIKAAGGSPVTIFAAPGAGKMTQILFTIYEYTFLTAAYVYPGSLCALYYGASGTNGGAAADNNDGSVLTNTVNTTNTASYQQTAGNPTSLQANQPLVYTTNDNSNPTTGSGTLKITVFYVTVTL